jgi:hypothetical protein
LPEDNTAVGKQSDATHVEGVYLYYGLTTQTISIEALGLRNAYVRERLYTEFAIAEHTVRLRPHSDDVAALGLR